MLDVSLLLRHSWVTREIDRLKADYNDVQNQTHKEERGEKRHIDKDYH